MSVAHVLRVDMRKKTPSYALDIIHDVVGWILAEVVLCRLHVCALDRAFRHALHARDNIPDLFVADVVARDAEPAGDCRGRRGVEGENREASNGTTYVAFARRGEPQGPGAERRVDVVWNVDADYASTITERGWLYRFREMRRTVRPENPTMEHATDELDDLRLALHRGTSRGGDLALRDPFVVVVPLEVGGVVVPVRDKRTELAKRVTPETALTFRTRSRNTPSRSRAGGLRGSAPCSRLRPAAGARRRRHQPLKRHPRGVR